MKNAVSRELLLTALRSAVSACICVRVFYSHCKQTYLGKTCTGLFTNPLFSLFYSLLPSLTLWQRAEAVSTQSSAAFSLFNFLCELVQSLHELGCTDDGCRFSQFMCTTPKIPLFLPQFQRPLTAPPFPWQLKVLCMSPGSREPMVGLQSQLSASSTDVAAVRSGLLLQIISHPSSCLWKFAIWSLVSFDIQ